LNLQVADSNESLQDSLKKTGLGRIQKIWSALCRASPTSYVLRLKKEEERLL
jgi:hypothetical protein